MFIFRVFFYYIFASEVSKIMMFPLKLIALNSLAPPLRPPTFSFLVFFFVSLCSLSPCLQVLPGGSLSLCSLPSALGGKDTQQEARS